MRRNWICLVVLLAVAPSWLYADTGAGPRPNIILLVADDLGFSDLGSYGSEIDTPNIDTIASTGVRFSNFHVATSCAPTRAMLLTGVSSHKAGVSNIPEAIPNYQAGAPAYQGVLRKDVTTLAERLSGMGYRTLLSGKWHLGRGAGELPSQRGFDRAFALADTGADNWRQRSYLPIYANANWFEDGEPIQLPDNFYSSKNIVDKAIEYLGEEAQAQPFFAYVAFQAVHIPVQAPASYRDKYIGVYDQGWHELRSRRAQGLVDMGILPQLGPVKAIATTPDWNSLTGEAQAFESRGMAVYAGMVDAMDHHIGRLIAHVDAMGEMDNTVFIFLSDNGAEGSLATRSPTGGMSVVSTPLRAWLWSKGFNTEFESLGERDSYHDVGPAWASASVGPLAWYKFYAGEGGMRVPLVVSGQVDGKPLAVAPGKVVHEFSWATDVMATVLDLAGAVQPEEGIEGKSILPLLQYQQSAAGTGLRSQDDVVGFELGGLKVLFQWPYKLLYNRTGLTPDRWQLFNIEQDPGETTDLWQEMPDKSAELLSLYRHWEQDNGVLPVAEDYNQRAEVFAKAFKNNPLVAVPFLSLFGLPLILLVAIGLLLRRWLRR